MGRTVEIELDDLHELAAMSLAGDDQDVEAVVQDVAESSLYQLYQQQD